MARSRHRQVNSHQLTNPIFQAAAREHPSDCKLIADLRLRLHLSTHPPTLSACEVPSISSTQVANSLYTNT